MDRLQADPWNVVLALLETARWLRFPGFPIKTIAISKSKAHRTPGDKPLLLPVTSLESK